MPVPIFYSVLNGQISSSSSVKTFMPFSLKSSAVTPSPPLSSPVNDPSYILPQPQDGLFAFNTAYFARFNPVGYFPVISMLSGISFVGMERIQFSGQLLERLKHGPGDLHPEAFLLSYGYLIICIAVQNILLHLLKQSAVQQPVYQRNEHIRRLFYYL